MGIRRIAKILLGRDVYTKVDCQLPTIRLGSGYGGWDVVPALIRHDSIIYSVGIGHDISFDLALINRFTCAVFGFDPTPAVVTWIREQHLPESFQFLPIALGAYDGLLELHPPKDPSHISFTMVGGQGRSDGSIKVECRTLDTLMASLSHSNLDLLKMDIEGAEYEVIRLLAQGNVRPSQLLVEFHHRFDSVGVEATREGIAILRSVGYLVAAVSKNGNEYTFIHESVAHPLRNSL